MPPDGTFYVTTPIYYVNDVPHLGHAYTTVAADALARYHRARGHRTFFLTGTDEHGQKIEDVARERGKSPTEHADEVVVRFRETWKNLDVLPDDFIRTTEDRHEKVVRDMWQRLVDAGDIYLGSFEGLYCRKCEAYYTETQAVEGNCPDHQVPLEVVKEPSYLFRMSRYQDALVEHFETHPGFVQPESRRNEILSFIRGGLRDLSVSRTTFGWGIKVPGQDDHVIYVWIDALTNYISALGGPGAQKYETFWPHTTHLIGKDILRFHAVYWPCMLMAAGLPLPGKIFAHGWWTLNSVKISKSLPATRVDPNQLADDIGADSLRYFLLREVPLGSDGDFTYESLIARHNSDLANDLGNLVNRTLSMTERYLGAAIPAPHDGFDDREPHRALAELARTAKAEAETHMDALAPSRALEAIWELVRGANRYVDTAAPWTLAKAIKNGEADKQRELEHVVHSFLEASLWAALLVAPIMPGKAGAIVDALGVDREKLTWPGTWNQTLAPGGTVDKPEPLFPRIDDDERERLLGRWLPPEARVAPPAPAKKEPAADLVSFDDFKRYEFRAARVVSAERVPKADKLLSVTVDLGTETRQVVAGLAARYAPEDLVGKTVILLANLAPATIRGVTSQGMILAAGDKEILGLSGLDSDVPPGTRIR